VVERVGVMSTLGGEHFHRAGSGPGTPAPRPATVSRVVAAVRSSTTKSSTAHLSSCGAPVSQHMASLLPQSYSATPNPLTCAFAPYRRVHTGEHAMVAIRMARFVSARITIAPPDFVKSQQPPPMVHTNSTQSLSSSASSSATGPPVNPTAVFVFPSRLICQRFA